MEDKKNTFEAHFENMMNILKKKANNNTEPLTFYVIAILERTIMLNSDRKSINHLLWEKDSTKNRPRRKTTKNMSQF